MLSPVPARDEGPCAQRQPGAHRADRGPGSASARQAAPGPGRPARQDRGVVAVRRPPAGARGVAPVGDRRRRSAARSGSRAAASPRRARPAAAGSFSRSQAHLATVNEAPGTLPTRSAQPRAPSRSAISACGLRGAAHVVPQQRRVHGPARRPRPARPARAAGRRSTIAARPLGVAGLPASASDSARPPLLRVALALRAGADRVRRTALAEHPPGLHVHGQRLGRLGRAVDTDDHVRRGHSVSIRGRGPRPTRGFPRAAPAY